MPTYKITDQRTGRTLRVKGDRPPTEQELEQIFSQYKVKQDRGLGESIIGAGEVGLAALTGAIAQPLSGLAGLARTAISGPEAGAQAVERWQQTLGYKPQTEAGQEYAQAIAEAPIISDIAQGMERGAKYAGEQTYELTGSPLAASIAQALPEAGAAALGAYAPGGLAASQARKLDDVAKQGAKAATRQSRVVDEDLLAASETTQALKSGKIKNIAEIVDADPKFYQALDELGITEKPLASYASNNPQFRGIEQSFAALPNSPQNAQALDFARGVSNVAQALAEKYDATDSVYKSLQWRDATLKTIDELGQAGDEAYNAINQVIDRRVPAQADNTRQFLQEATENLALGIDDPDVPKVIKDAYKSLQARQVETQEGVKFVPPTYENLDLLRRKIGAAAFKNEGDFKDAEKGLLKALYGKLTDDVNAMAEAQGLGEQVKAGKSLIAQRKGLEERTQALIGDKLQKDIIPVIQQGVKGLAKGGAQKFNDLMKQIPDTQTRQELIMTALNDTFTKTLKGERQFGTTDFLKWYDGAMTKGASRELISKHLPSDAVKTLDNLAVISRGVAKATAQKIPTGVVNSVLNDETGVLAKMAGRAASKFGDTGFMIGEVLLNKTPRVEKTRDLLADPKFQNLIARGVAQGIVQGKKATQNLKLAEKRLKQTAKYKEWEKTLSSDEAKAVSLGLTEFLLASQQEQD